MTSFSAAHQRTRLGGVFHAIVREPEVAEQQPTTRRSFLARIVGGTALAGGATNLILGGEAQAITDRDANDAVGHGRGRRRRHYGVTDRDANDAIGHGRGRRRHYGSTDTDANDAAGHGRYWN